MRCQRGSSTPVRTRPWSGPAELLTEIRLPIRPGGGSGYQKVARRAGDWPVGAAGAAVWLDGDVDRRRGIGLTAVGATHFVAAEAEEYLRGRPADEESLRAGRARSRPRTAARSSDQRGPADYKRHLASELTTRVLRLAVARARGAGRAWATVMRLTLTVNGTEYTPRRRAAAAAHPLPARRPRPDRLALGL